MAWDEFELSENSPSGPQKPLTFNKLGTFLCPNLKGALITKGPLGVFIQTLKLYFFGAVAAATRPLASKNSSA